MMLVSALDDGNPKRLASPGQPVRCWQARRHEIAARITDQLSKVRSKARP